MFLIFVGQWEQLLKVNKVEQTATQGRRQWKVQKTFNLLPKHPTTTDIYINFRQWIFGKCKKLVNPNNIFSLYQRLWAIVTKTGQTTKPSVIDKGLRKQLFILAKAACAPGLWLGFGGVAWGVSLFRSCSHRHKMSKVGWGSGKSSNLCFAMGGVLGTAFCSSSIEAQGASNCILAGYSSFCPSSIEVIQLIASWIN